eukprot:scaffold98103_cov29-Tisochrysis_lutea.AAC.1
MRAGVAEGLLLSLLEREEGRGGREEREGETRGKAVAEGEESAGVACGAEGGGEAVGRGAPEVYVEEREVHLALSFALSLPLPPSPSLSVLALPLSLPHSLSPSLSPSLPLSLSLSHIYTGTHLHTHTEKSTRRSHESPKETRGPNSRWTPEA